jgi:glycosyltransferase involved in cell wall biosynthesis/SAM-dependent methyltransferase
MELVPRIVLLTTSLARGGAETQVVHLAVELRALGWSVAVVSMLPPTAFTGELAGAGVETFSLGMSPSVADLRGLFRLCAFLYRFRPQILHSHMFHANMLARAARLFCPVPVVVSSIHSVAETGRDSHRIGPRDWLYAATDPLADMVVAVSRAAAERHAGAHAVRRAKLRVIPNGVDTAIFRPDPRRESERRRLNVGSAFVWLAAGRLMWKKDYPTLLRAFAAQRGAVLLIAGQGPQEAELQALARELAVDARFLGPVDDMPALMNAADALVLSSVVEGLPIALIEAACSGLPAVATDAGGVREAVLDGQTGFICPPRDPAALAEAMSRLAALSPEACARMGLAARAHAVACFDLKRVAATWDRAYRELLDPAWGHAFRVAAGLWPGVPARSAPAQKPAAGPKAWPHMDVTSRFVLDFARRFAAGRERAAILDFGCGAGGLVAAGRAEGLDICGVDIFYGGSGARAQAEASPLWGPAIQPIIDGHIPFPDASFQLVVNNQVMEHAEDLDAVLAEIHRVLVPGGTLLSIFPSRDVWREGHIGISFAHWFRKGSRWRFLYTWALRSLGFGYWKEEAASRRQWATDKLAWIDAYTHYRPRRELFRSFGRYFDNELREPEYIRFRLRDRKWRAPLARLLDLPFAPAAASAVFRKLAFLVILSRKARP